MVSLHTVWYGFARKTFKTMDNIVARTDAAAPAAKPRGPYKRRAAADVR
jgi:hypothetical protein